MQILLLRTFSTCFGRHVPVAAVSVLYTPDDGCMTPETYRESLQ